MRNLATPCLLFLASIFHSFESAAVDNFLRCAFTEHACVNAVVACHVSDKPEDLSRRLLRNTNATVCNPSMGIQQKRSVHKGVGLRSSGTTSDVLGSLMKQRQGISVELWIKPGQTTTMQKRNPVFTIGVQDTKEPGQFGFSTCDSEGFDLQLSQLDGHFEIAFRTSDKVIEPCQVHLVDQVPSLEPDELVHIIISLSDGNQQVFVNGQLAASFSQSFANDLQHWHSDWGLQLFGSSYPELIQWTGSVYEVTFYAGRLGLDDAEARLFEGLPAAVPVPLDTLVHINEDAEDVAGSHSTTWYEQEAPSNDRGRFELPYDSMQKEVEAFQRKLNRTPIKLLPPVFFYVTSLPAVGRLFHANGTPLDPADLHFSGVIPVSSGDGLAYVPPLHSHSDALQNTYAFATFTYCVSDVHVLVAKQCISSKVSIHVVPVNDPPIANKLGMITLREGNNTFLLPKIPLLGTDVDIGDSIRSVEITQPPAQGDLHLSVSSFRSDGFGHGTPVADLDYAISAADPVYLNYVWDAGLNGNIVQGQTTKDMFLYRVEDQRGVWSTEVQVDLRVLPSLSAKVNQILVIEEDSNNAGNVKWYCRDESGFNRRVSFFVETVPSSNQGVLLQPVSKSPIEAHTYLDAFDSYPYSRGFDLTFVPSRDFCAYRHSEEADVVTIQFRVAAFVESAIVSVSEVFEQHLQVKCSIDTLLLNVPSEAIMIKEFTLRRAAVDPCHRSVHSTVGLDTTECPASAIVNGIHVANRDGRARQAVVTVLPGSGYITFTDKGWKHVEPIIGRRAVASGNITFLAYPEDLTAVFADLHFHSYRTGVDRIDIVIIYGDCASVGIDWREAFQSISTSSCQILPASIDVYVDKDEEKYSAKEKLADDFPWQIVICISLYPALFFALVRLELLLEDSRDATPRWIQHQADTGDFYYEDVVTGSVTWMAPVGQVFVPWKEE